jgi:hypothetical protein
LRIFLGLRLIAGVLLVGLLPVAAPLLVLAALLAAQAMA